VISSEIANYEDDNVPCDTDFQCSRYCTCNCGTICRSGYLSTVDLGEPQQTYYVHCTSGPLGFRSGLSSHAVECRVCLNLLHKLPNRVCQKLHSFL